MKMGLLLEKGISLERLDALVRVWRAGGLASAAPGSVITQNLIGRQLRDLEGFFGSKLTERVGRVVRLTDLGKKLAQTTARYLDELIDIKAEVAQLRMRLTIAAGGSLYSELISSGVVALRQSHPQMLPRVRELHHEQLFEAVYQGEVDIGVSWEKPPSALHLATYQLGVIRYAMYGARTIEMNRGELHRKPTVVVLHREYTDDLRAHISTDDIVVVDETRLAVRMVQTGRYVAVLPTIYASQLPQATYQSKDVPWMKPYERNIWAVWNPRVALRRGFDMKQMRNVAEAFRPSMGL